MTGLLLRFLATLINGRVGWFIFEHIRAYSSQGPQVVYIDFGLSQAFARKVENVTGTSAPQVNSRASCSHESHRVTFMSCAILCFAALQTDLFILNYSYSLFFSNSCSPNPLHPVAAQGFCMFLSLVIGSSHVKSSSYILMPHDIVRYMMITWCTCARLPRPGYIPPETWQEKANVAAMAQSFAVKWEWDSTGMYRAPKYKDIIKNSSNILNILTRWIYQQISTDADTLNCFLASLFARCRHGIQVVTFLASELLGLHGKRGSIVYFVVPNWTSTNLNKAPHPSL